MKSKVYFMKDITPENIVKIYKKFGHELTGNIAIKVHSGEEGNQNYLGPDYLKPIVEYTKGTIVECNTAYPGARTNNKDHEKLMFDHGWSRYFDVDIMDRDGFIEVPIPNGKVIQRNYLGSHIKNYDSMLVIAHFKGHPMGGFGGALKQLAIGCASREGKAYIHSAGKTLDANKIWNDLPPQDSFIMAMADAASTVANRFKDNIVYINIMKNMSVDCDCCAKAEDPCLKDIGILISDDPIAIDAACIDLVKSSNDIGRDHFMERVNSRHGTYIIDAACELGYGTKEYELINVD